MSQIIVNPDEQRAFANALEDLVREMSSRERAVTSHLHDLRKSWQDTHAKSFERSHEEMSLYLSAFYRRAEDYARYLRRKAALADKYLGCGR